MFRAGERQNKEVLAGIQSAMDGLWLSAFAEQCMNMGNSSVGRAWDSFPGEVKKLIGA
jgi:hypothetical protein